MYYMDNPPGIVVVKFGGSILENDESISKAAEVVAKAVGRGLRVIVVVSAMRGVTDNLLTLSRRLNPDVKPHFLDDLLSFGERTSARLFAAALQAKGLNPVVIDPDSEFWPIITDDNHLDANPIIEESMKLALEKLLPLLMRGKIPVVCGFIGKTRDGKITTLGRGGSDTTAVILGQALNANEVVLVKDTEGVLSSDPDKVNGVHQIKELQGVEAEQLALGGARFIHSKALRYKTNRLRIRITNLDKFDSGTLIEGELPDLSAELSNEKVTMLTLIGVNTSDSDKLLELSHVIRDCNANILAITLEQNSAVLYIEGGSNILNSIHERLVSKGIGKAISAFEGLCMITIRGTALEKTPGLVQRVTQPLARARINLFGVITILSSIKLFVDSSQAKSALDMVKSALLVSEK